MLGMLDTLLREGFYKCDVRSERGIFNIYIVCLLSLFDGKFN